MQNITYKRMFPTRKKNETLEIRIGLMDVHRTQLFFVTQIQFKTVNFTP